MGFCNHRLCKQQTGVWPSSWKQKKQVPKHVLGFIDASRSAVVAIDYGWCVVCDCRALGEQAGGYETKKFGKAVKFDKVVNFGKVENFDKVVKSDKEEKSDKLVVDGSPRCVCFFDADLRRRAVVGWICWSLCSREKRWHKVEAKNGEIRFAKLARGIQWGELNGN